MSSKHLMHLRSWLVHSPPGEWLLQRARELLISALRQGPVPQHVAFVMDGNRRYARERRMETVEGHHLGAEALARVSLGSDRVSRAQPDVETDPGGVL